MRKKERESARVWKENANSSREIGAQRQARIASPPIYSLTIVRDINILSESYIFNSLNIPIFLKIN